MDLDVILELIIFFGDNFTETFRFKKVLYVEAAIAEIKDKTKLEAQDFGLFLCNEATGAGWWLDNGRTLQNYPFQKGKLYFKSKQRELKISLEDGSIHHLQTFEDTTCLEACAKLQTLLFPRSLDKYAIQHNNVWLDDTMTIQQVAHDDVPLFTIRDPYFRKLDNPFLLELSFTEAKIAIVKGQYPVSIPEAIEAAGLLCQIASEQHELTETPVDLDYKSMVPLRMRVYEDIIPSIQESHANLKGLSAIDAKYRFLRLVRNLPSYGSRFLEALFVRQGDFPYERVAVAISKQGIVLYSLQQREAIYYWPFRLLARYAQPDEGRVLFDFGVNHHEHVELRFVQAQAKLDSELIDIFNKEIQEILATLVKTDAIMNQIFDSDPQDQTTTQSTG